ncbi:hypothetical protein NDU88_004825 [Pleurodeles waltl]|uniref:Uncharacterized protein n=1 Tax=Pleurodeles waltl TaxID=8319 RepID=A0AAV7WYZ2_PLEWA|nr:hypothetical protein NDU88_004825 [Pleurodeles waltl]
MSGSGPAPWTPQLLRLVVGPSGGCELGHSRRALSWRPLAPSPLGVGDESCRGPLGVPPYLMTEGVERPSRKSSLDLQLDIEATTDVVRAGSIRIKLSHILC